jgi:hypothetical protein
MWQRGNALIAECASDCSDLRATAPALSQVRRAVERVKVAFAESICRKRVARSDGSQSIGYPPLQGSPRDGTRGAFLLLNPKAA